MAGDDDRFDSSVRFDDRPLERVSWNESTTNEATFASRPQSVLNSLLRADTVFVRIWTFSDEAHDAEFTVTGLKSEMDKYPDLCG